MTNKSIKFGIALFLIIAAIGCRNEDFNDKVVIPDFNFTKTIVFEDSLSAYQIFEGKPNTLSPSSDFQLLELSSTLFSDYSHKQRLVKIPVGKTASIASNYAVNYPNGTILTKTFFYYNDERDTSLGKRIIETRLLIKESESWNAATYVWNEEQTNAYLKLDGLNTNISWINESGTSRSTNYHIPTENECMTCHQSNGAMTHLGPTLLNLNRTVDRNGSSVNQLDHLKNEGILGTLPSGELPTMVNYKDKTKPLANRGLAYLAMNCAHCHNPSAWDTPAGKGLDFRHNTPFDQSGISDKKDEIIRNIQNEEMPFIGTTMQHDEGAALIIEYIASL